MSICEILKELSLMYNPKHYNLLEIYVSYAYQEDYKRKHPLIWVLS